MDCPIELDAKLSATWINNWMIWLGRSIESSFPFVIISTWNHQLVTIYYCQSSLRVEEKTEIWKPYQGIKAKEQTPDASDYYLNYFL